MPTAQSNSAPDRIQQPFFLIIRDGPHRPNQHNKVEFPKFVRITKDVECLYELLAVPADSTQALKMPEITRFVTFPPPYYK